MVSPLNLSDIDVVWIAAILDGEGSFGLDRRSKKRYNVSTSPPAPTLQISMTDEDVIQRLANLLNKSYKKESRKTVTGKNVYKLQIGDRETLIYLLPRILSHLSQRRAKAVQECIDQLDAWQRWLAEGGRSKMAQEGTKKEKLMKSKSDITTDITINLHKE